MLFQHYGTRGGLPPCKRQAVNISTPRPSRAGAWQHADGASSGGSRFLGHISRASGGEDAPSAAPVSPDLGEAARPKAQDGPWTPEQILGLVQRQQEEDEAMYSQAVTGGLLGDPEGLYEYVNRAYDEGPRRVTTPFALMMEEQTGLPTVSFPPAVANDIVGIGTWRLKDLFDPMLEFMVSRIEGCWREVLDTDLNLYPRALWKEQGWDLVDSEDPKRELDGFSFADIPDPEEGAEGYPRLQIENRVYCSKVFRKLHVEVAVRQDGMQVLHVVAYPRYSYDLPIFGLDIVLIGDRVTLAVVDCCPVRKDLKLPAHYMETMTVLQRTFLSNVDPVSRRIPAWGAESFSPLAVCMSPSSPEQLAAFVKYSVALHRAHMLMSLAAAPVVAAPGDWRQEARLRELQDGQKRFCDKQLANIKTRRVLEVAFGKEWTDAYMRELMFDFDPSYEPPFFDASYERLYTYFDENPEFGALADEAWNMEVAAEGDRAEETIRYAALGKSVPRDKLEMAVGFLYENDPTFRAAINTLNGGEQQVAPQEFVTEEFVKLLQMSPEGLQEEAGKRTKA